MNVYSIIIIFVIDYPKESYLLNRVLSHVQIGIHVLTAWIMVDVSGVEQQM